MLTDKQETINTNIFRPRVHADALKQVKVRAVLLISTLEISYTEIQDKCTNQRSK